MTEKPFVSVIINCYNGADFLEDAIDSVLKQTYEHFEIVIWDNQSTDNTAEIIKRIEDRRIRYFLATQKTPLGQARNLAMEKTTGDYVCYLDSDDLWEPSYLEVCVDILSHNDDVGLVYTRYINFSKTARWLSKGMGKSGVVDTGIFIKGYNIGMSAAMFKMSHIYLNHIFFDTRFSLIEDFSFFVRLACVSCVYFVDKPLMNYRHHDHQNSISDKWADEFDVMIKGVQNGEFPPLVPYCNSMLNLQRHYEIMRAVNQGNRILAIKILFSQCWKDGEVFRYLLPIFFGKKIYSFMRKTMGSFRYIK